MTSIMSDSDCWTQYTMEACSPCSSGLTITSLAEDSHSVIAGQNLTIMLPNLVDRFSLAIGDIENFVSAKAGKHSELTILHLLIYLFTTSTDPAVTHINNIKLIHKGRSHSIQRACDLSDNSPRLRDLVENFPTFQLIIVPSSSHLRPKMSEEAMLARIGSASETASQSSATYAEAMVKLFKNTTRKPSVGSIESRSVTTRFASRDSATDVESNSDGHRIKGKFRNSLKRIFKKDSHAELQVTTATSFLTAF